MNSYVKKYLLNQEYEGFTVLYIIKYELCKLFMVYHISELYTGRPVLHPDR